MVVYNVDGIVQDIKWSVMHGACTVFFEGGILIMCSCV